MNNVNDSAMDLEPRSGARTSEHRRRSRSATLRSAVEERPEIGPETRRGVMGFVPGVTRGYLLLETLAVTAILAMICAIIVPTVVRSANARVLRAAAYELAQTLRQARESALLEGRPSQVVLDGNAGSFRVQWLDPDENGTRRFQKSHILPEGIRIQQVLRSGMEAESESATAVPFTTGGLSQETWITLADTRGDTYSVRVSPSGKVTVYEEE